jgi:Ulp1 family protease
MLLKHDNFNEYRGLLIPYNHKANHWTLIKVDFEERQITYLDSMYSNLQKYDDFVQVRLQAVRTSLTNRMVRLPHLSRNIPEEAWVLISDGVGVSIQRNTFDCGVFTLMMADFITLGFQIDGLVPISRAYRRMILVQLWNLLNGEE